MSEKYLDVEELEIDVADLEPLPELETVVPSMVVPGISEGFQEPANDLIKDEKIIGIYDEILEQIRKDREETSDVLNNFVDMVMNDGDSSSASKEAIVQLLKLKMDSSNNMSKVADLMTRVKLREKNDFPRYMNAHQTNNISIGDNGAKKELLRTLNKSKKKVEHKD